eukprot:SAG31_NODE_2715_length_5203_cov_11.749412_3_plen_82_part_00
MHPNAHHHTWAGMHGHGSCSCSRAASAAPPAGLRGLAAVLTECARNPAARRAPHPTPRARHSGQWVIVLVVRSGAGSFKQL